MTRAACVIPLMILVAACQSPAETPAPPALPPATASAREVPADVPAASPEREPAGPAKTTKEANIFIDAITVANPLVVRGRARTFENAVSLRVRDGRDVIAETFTTSAGEMGKHNPFEAKVWLTRMPESRITVEAFEYSARDGAVESLVSEVVDLQLPPVAVTIDFPLSDCTKLAAFERNVPRSPAMARVLVEALIAGPTASEKARGASSPFPRGAAVKSMLLRDGLLTIDFNERLRNVGGACAVEAIRASLTKTLTRLPSVKKVVILAEGSEALALQP
jgi:hypothetical protein